MKNKTSILFILVTFFNFHLIFAQKVQINWGNTNQGAAVTAQERKFLKLDGENYYMMLSSKDPLIGSVKLHLICFDKKLQLKYSKDVSLTKNGPNEYIPRGYAEVGDKLFAVSTLFNKKDKKHKLYFMRIDYKTGKTGDVEEKGSIEAESEKKMGSFDISCSNDRSKLAIIASPVAGKDEEEKVQITVYNADMQKVWGNNFDLPLKNLKVNKNQICVADNGIIYILKKYQERTTVKYAFFVSDEKGKKIKKIDYEIEDDILDYRYFTDINNSLIISGLYRSASESRAGEKNITGNFFLELDVTAKIAQQNYSQFKEKLYNLKINNIVNDNTASIMLCEFIQSTPKNTTTPDPNNSNEVSSTGCIVIATDGEGKNIWEKRIVREMMSSSQDNGAIARFQFVNHPGRIGIVYFDKEYFYSKELKQLPDNEQFVLPVFTEISKDGEMSNALPLNNNESWGKESKTTFIIKAMLPIGMNEYLIYAEDGNNTKIGKLNVEK